jgi:hypothetical protein
LVSGVKEVVAMTTHVVSNDDLGTVSRRYWEVQRRMMEGTLDASLIARNLQLTAEGASLDTPRPQPLIVSPFFAGEEVASTRTYPAGYAHKPVCEQLVVLASDLSSVGVHLDSSRILSCSKEPLVLPVGAEAPFAVPKWHRVAQTYNEATEKVFAALARKRKFTNWREGKLGPKYLRLSDRTQWAHEMLDKQYPGDYMLVFAQFGLLWRGRSVRKVRVNYAPHEFGLGPYEVGVMILSHAERIVGDPNELYIDCPGAEHAPGGDGEFLSAPIFDWSDAGLLFDTVFVDFPSSYCGSASSFLPQ